MPNNIHTDQAGLDNVHEYLTENPYTKVLDQFPNRLAKEEIPNVIISDEIGSGSHARVYKGEFLDTPVAIKVYKNQNPLSLNAFISELEAYYSKPSQEHCGKVLSHPNVVSILAAYQNGTKSYLINELCDLGSMHQMKSLSQKMKVSACLQVAQALNYLHTQANIYHRDIKSENVLVYAADAARDTI